MLLRDIVALLDGRVLTGEGGLDRDIVTACGADLMSDVLAFIHSGSLLLTGLTNPQVIRTAEVVDVSAIIFVRGKLPPQETIELAEEREMTLVSAPYTLFECCGRLYAAGIEACDVRGEARRCADRRLREFVGHGTIAGNATG